MRYIEISRESLEDLYWGKNMSANDIARLLGCSDMTIRRHLHKFGIRTRNRIEAAGLKNTQPRVHVDWSKKDALAYILGVMYGDGCLSKYKRGGYRILLGVTSRVFAESFARALERVGLRPNIWADEKRGNNHQPIHNVKVCSKELGEWLVDMDIKKTEEFLGSDSMLIKEFLRGFYESEGYLGLRAKNALRVEMTNTNVELVNLVKRLLEKLGFEVSVRLSVRRGKQSSWKDGYNIRILGGTEKAEKFLREVEPCIKNIPYKGGWRDIEGG